MERTMQFFRSETSWWILLLQGIVALVIGLLFLASPTMSVSFLIRILGLYWLISGIVTLCGMFVERANNRYAFIPSIIAILLGIIVLRYPFWALVLTPAVLLLILAIGGIIYGVLHLLMSLAQKKPGGLIVGVISIIAGILLLISFPLLGGFLLLSSALVSLAIPILIGLCGVIGGIALIVYAFRQRKKEQGEMVQTATMPPESV